MSSSAARSRSPATLAFALFFVSGALGLAYEVIWLRQLVLEFGSTLYATSAILSTFMAGLALGAYFAGWWIDRRAFAPLAVYGVLELGVGALALLEPSLLRALDPLYRLAWEAGASGSFTVLSLAKWAGVTIVLLPPAILMGASLPVLSRHVAAQARSAGARVGMLYAVNTFGAVLGTLLTGFVALPAFGMSRTLTGAALVNLGLGLVALALSRGPGPSSPALDEPSVASMPPRPAPRRPLLVLVAFGLSGFGAMLLEVAWTRGLSLVLGSSVYAFSLMLAGFLLGLACGSAALARVLRRRPALDPAIVLVVLFAVAGLFTFATSVVLTLLPGIYGRLHFAGSTSPTGSLFIEAAFALIVMFPTTFALGGVFPAVVELRAARRTGLARAVGTAYASNTVGTIAGAAVAGFVLVPALGVRDTVVAAALLELALALGVLMLVVDRPVRVRARFAAPLVVVLALVPLLAPGWDVQVMNAGVYVNLPDRTSKGAGWDAYVRLLRRDHRMVFAKDGLTASVVVADFLPSGSRYLAVNGKVDASTLGDLETQVLLAQLPLLLHDAPEDVLIVGLGSGITLGSAATHSSVRRLRVVEVEAAMFEAARLFSSANGAVLDDPRVTTSINDARNELQFDPATYDVIISEPSNPWMTVASNLFTEDFFRKARARLRPKGIFAQWVQGYGLAPDDLRSILAAFRSAFPQVLVFELSGGIDYVLIGSAQPARFDREALAARMSERRVALDLERGHVRMPADVLALLRAGDAEVEALVAGAERNTDDNARVEYDAPRSLSLDTQAANLAMLSAREPDPLVLLREPIADPRARDALRLEVARAWLRRGYVERAAAAARALLEGPMLTEAKALLEQAPTPPR